MTRRAVQIGKVQIGGGAPVVVQSMTNTDTSDVQATVAQIHRLTQAGCEIVRVAVPSLKAVGALPEIKKRISIPLVADIHFDHRLALGAIEAGVDKLRLNPGNITDAGKITQVVQEAKAARIPIRVGANSGSIAKEFLDSRGHVTASGMVKSVVNQVHLLESLDFPDIVISVKGTNVLMTIDAYREIAKQVNYPLHVGITEAGGPREGSIRSAVGLGILLAEGLGDTLRVSLTGDPVEEVRTAYEILRSLNLRNRGITYRICPTCGRTKIDLATIADQVQQALADVVEPLTIALMGCVVNGIGEVQEVDIGVVGGDANGTIYVRGEIIKRTVPEQNLVQEIVAASREFLEKSRES